MSLIDAGQISDIFAAGMPVARDGTRHFTVEVDGSTIMIVGGQLEAGLIDAAHLAPGAVTPPAIAFDSGDIPHSSPSIASTDVEAALEEVALGYLACLPLAGGVMSGPIDMSANGITGLPDPVVPSAAVNLETAQELVYNLRYYGPPTGYAGLGLPNGALKPTWKRATASVLLTANPAPGDTITIHGVTLTFAAVAGPNLILIGPTPANTSSNAVSEINANASLTLDAIPLNTEFFAIQGNGLGTEFHLVVLTEDPPNTPEDGDLKQLTAVSLVLALRAFEGGLGAPVDGMLCTDLYADVVYAYDRMTPDWRDISGAGGPVDATNVQYTGPAIPFIGPTPSDLQSLLIALDASIAAGLTPGAHAPSHEDGGGDDIDVTNLSGLLADPQTPLGHHLTHEDGALDEIDVTNLTGLLADPQNAGWLQGTLVGAAAPVLGDYLSYDGVQWVPVAAGSTSELFFAGAGIGIGEAVVISGDDTVSPAIATAAATAHVIGIATAAFVPGPLPGPVKTSLGRKVLAQFETGLALSANNIVYLSKTVAGALTNVTPAAPAAYKKVGLVSDASAYVGLVPANSFATIVLQTETTVWVP